MSSISFANQAIKKNRAMMHKPCLYKNLNRFHKDASLGNLNFPKMTKEEREIFETKMKKAKRDGRIKEVKFYSMAIIITTIGLYFIFNLEIFKKIFDALNPVHSAIY